MAAQQQLLALMSSASGHNNNNSPETLYDLSLIAVVNGLDCKVPTLERIHKLPELPRNLLIDVYELVSVRAVPAARREQEQQYRVLKVKTYREQLNESQISCCCCPVARV